MSLITQEKLLALLDHTLHLNGRALRFTAETPLLGSLPELDSMAVVTLVAALEEQFGLEIADDELDGTVFATVGNLFEFVRARV